MLKTVNVRSLYLYIIIDVVSYFICNDVSQITSLCWQMLTASVNLFRNTCVNHTALTVSVHPMGREMLCVYVLKSLRLKTVNSADFAFSLGLRFPVCNIRNYFPIHILRSS